MSHHKTSGIVLKTVRYGETSIIATIYTELFGLQSYLVNGVRSSSKKGAGRANLFQPAAILELIVYHNELKNLQRIREFKWGHIYSQVFFSVPRNAVALFMVELLIRSLKQPESNAPLYHFIEQAFLDLDEANESETAVFPLDFALRLSRHYGFGLRDIYSERSNILDLKEGEFVQERPVHPYFLEGIYSELTSELLKSATHREAAGIRIKRETRRALLHAYETFYALHIQDFGTLQTLPVLETVLDK